MSNTIKSRKRALIFGFLTLFLCGIGDWLIGYYPQGGRPLIFGITTTAIATIPSWFFILSMIFGVLSGFGCKEYAPVMVDILKDLGGSRYPRMFKAFRFGFSSAPLMFISFHTACCVALLLLQAALRAGVTAEAAEKYFLLPVAASLIPFTVWCFVVDIPITVAYMYFVIKGTLKLSKPYAVLCPWGMSLLAKLIYAVLVAVGREELAFLTACGESWGHAFMCLAFYRLYLNGIGVH